MAASNLKNIALKSIEKGWLPDTPVVLVYNVSQPDQEEFYLDLKELATGNYQFPTPLITIIGDVVGLKNSKGKGLQDSRC